MDLHVIDIQYCILAQDFDVLVSGVLVLVEEGLAFDDEMSGS